MVFRQEERNIRRLGLYLRPKKYSQGITYVNKMNKYFFNRDVDGFLKYLLKYLKVVVRTKDDVAEFRAMKMIDKCYGTFMDKKFIDQS